MVKINIMSIGISLGGDQYNDEIYSTSYEPTKEDLVRHINNLSIKDRRWVIMEIQKTSLDYLTKTLKRKK